MSSRRYVTPRRVRWHVHLLEFTSVYSDRARPEYSRSHVDFDLNCPRPAVDDYEPRTVHLRAFG